MMKKMDLGEFEAALDKYGADWSRWPTQAAQAAQALMEQDERAGRSWEVACEVGRMLDEALLPVEPSAVLLRRLAAIPVEHPRSSRRYWTWLWQPVSVALMAGLAGLFVGTFEQQDDMGDVVVSESEQSLEEASDWALVELAFADEYLEGWQ